jgi:hypothetical protein
MIWELLEGFKYLQIALGKMQQCETEKEEWTRPPVCAVWPSSKNQIDLT